MPLDRQFRLPRIWSNRELRRLGPLFTGRIVNVSAGEDTDKEGNTYRSYFPNSDSWHITNYSPGSYRGYSGRDNEILLDLTAEFPEEFRSQFDVVINHTTLEHIFDVEKAFKNICNLTRDIAIIIVPFCQSQHETSDFLDYWRFTPSCLRELFRRNCMEVVYESESPYRDAGVYLLMIGSKSPGKWYSLLPTSLPIGHAGSWIGRSSFPSLTNLSRRFTNLIKRQPK